MVDGQTYHPVMTEALWGCIVVYYFSMESAYVCYNRPLWL